MFSKASSCKITSTVLIVFGVFIAIIPLGLRFITAKDISKIDIIPFGIPLSLGIALISIGLAFDSTANMIDTANVEFLKAASDFVEARSRYIMHPNQQAFQGFLWYSKTHLKRAVEVNLKIIKPEHQIAFYSYFYVTLWQIFDVKNPIFNLQWNTIRESDRNQIVEMYSIIRIFKKKIWN